MTEDAPDAGRRDGRQSLGPSGADRRAPASSWPAQTASGPPGSPKRLHLSPTTICKWRTRFSPTGSTAWPTNRGPGAPRRIIDAKIEDTTISRIFAHLRIAAAPDRDVQVVAGFAD